MIAHHKKCLPFTLIIGGSKYMLVDSYFLHGKHVHILEEICSNNSFMIEVG